MHQTCLAIHNRVASSVLVLGRSTGENDPWHRGLDCEVWPFVPGFPCQSSFTLQKRHEYLLVNKSRGLFCCQCWYRGSEGIARFADPEEEPSRAGRCTNPKDSQGRRRDEWSEIHRRNDIDQPIDAENVSRLPPPLSGTGADSGPGFGAGSGRCGGTQRANRAGSHRHRTSG